MLPNVRILCHIHEIHLTLYLDSYDKRAMTFSLPRVRPQGEPVVIRKQPITNDTKLNPIEITQLAPITTLPTTVMDAPQSIPNINLTDEP